MSAPVFPFSIANYCDSPMKGAHLEGNWSLKSCNPLVSSVFRPLHHYQYSANPSIPGSGYLPLIIYLGMYFPGHMKKWKNSYCWLINEGYTYSEPKPSLFKYAGVHSLRCAQPLTLPIGCSHHLPERWLSWGFMILSMSFSNSKSSS